MKYEVCDNCRHCMSRSYDHSCDGVKHRCICGLRKTTMSLYDECDKWEDYKNESR